MAFPSFSIPCPNSQIIANHHMQSISFASGGDPVSWGTEQRWWEKSKGLVIGKTLIREVGVLGLWGYLKRTGF